MIASIFGGIGAVFGGLSAWWWFASAKTPPVYNTAVLDGPNPAERERIDRQARLNAKAAMATGIAVMCQAVVLALGSAHISN